MISEIYRFIFLHVPKTAGNSIQSVLMPFSSDYMTSNEFQDGQERFGIKGPITPFKHATLSDYKSVLGDELSTYKLAISVRHPLQRALSYYYMPRRWMQKAPDGHVIPLEPFWDSDKFIDVLQEIKPASEFLCIDGKYQNPDHVIRLESVDQDFERFCRDFGIDLKGKGLPHVNRSTQRIEPNQDGRITPKIQAAVRDRFSQDYLNFDYD